ncbi:MAG: hypothetical protein P4M10_05865 [Verrucomicrobiae bacterium]|nr:hypothetical protein [Verrucomicrobiae bacterium]
MISYLLVFISKNRSTNMIPNMKHIMRPSFVLLLAVFFTAASAYCGVDKSTGMYIPTTNGLELTFQTIIDSAKMRDQNAEMARTVSYQYHDEKTQLIANLINIVADASASKLNHGMAAYYLGDLRAVEASDILARNITLYLGMETTALYQGLPLVSGLVARDALIKVGSPSIPALVRNLTESDDAKVNDLSLQVLVKIEGDKDIVRLRLQKALAAETNADKQARLKAALKLLETSRY